MTQVERCKESKHNINSFTAVNLTVVVLITISNILDTIHKPYFIQSINNFKKLIFIVPKYNDLFSKFYRDKYLSLGLTKHSLLLYAEKE